MSKHELITYIRNLKQVIDYYVINKIAVTKGIVDDDIIKICNTLVETETIFQNDFYNFLYKEILFYEDLKKKCNNCNLFLKECNKHYIQTKEQLNDLNKEFYTSFILMNINRIICELYDIYGE